MNPVTESKKNHLWRKTLWHTDLDLHPLGPTHCVEVYCSEESNGYAVWYVRRLSKDDERGRKGIENGDYLIGYFGKTRRDEAIEQAVLLAHSHSNIAQLIENLDTRAQAAQKV